MRVTRSLNVWPRFVEDVVDAIVEVAVRREAVPRVAISEELRPVTRFLAVHFELRVAQVREHDLVRRDAAVRYGQQKTGETNQLTSCRWIHVWWVVEVASPYL